MPAPETKDLCSTDNLFALFDSAPQWKKAETEIKQACDRAAAEIKALQEKHRAAGALDTVSRTEIVAYISALIDGFPEPDSDHYKIAREQRNAGGGTYEEVYNHLKKLGKIKSMSTV
jgi:hypothetical protein